MDLLQPFHHLQLIGNLYHIASSIMIEEGKASSPFKISEKKKASTDR